MCVALRFELHNRHSLAQYLRCIDGLRIKKKRNVKREGAISKINHEPSGLLMARDVLNDIPS